jgi:3-phenylpropionate/cinnamic acid dioxygenase small subunit
MAAAVSLELQHEIEQFLFLEAALLDEGRFHEWLAILADDIHYWMPTRYNRARRPLPVQSAGRIAFFDASKSSPACA